jgi:hypothetical protein
MKLDIHERDIGSELCRLCAACCRVTFKLRNTTPRYRRFLRQIGYTLLPGAEPGKEDCCEKKHDATVDMGYCKHLEIGHPEGGDVYRCLIYESGRLPDLCVQFNCVSWAKANENYAQSNSLLVRAQSAKNRLRERNP